MGHLLRNSEADAALGRSPARTSVTNAPFWASNDTQDLRGRPSLGFILGISKQMAIFRRNPRKVPLALRPMRQSTHANGPPGSCGVTSRPIRVTPSDGPAKTGAGTRRDGVGTGGKRVRQPDEARRPVGKRHLPASERRRTQRKASLAAGGGRRQRLAAGRRQGRRQRKAADARWPIMAAKLADEREAG